MFSSPVIEVSGLGKCYPMYNRPADRLKEILALPVAMALGRAPRQFGEPFWALRDVSFRIGKGESVGVIGPNGSGKSTLLQMLYGTLRPTKGTVRVDGRMTALLELGAGFNPEYTGRENARLTCVLNGLDSDAIERRLPEIEAFAEIGSFFDRPVKLYSSGMYVRLAFSAAIHCDPDILIVDEALAVGDQYFQARCFQMLHALLSRGTTLVLVSHAMSQVKALCNRALVIHQGRLVFDGAVDQASDTYLSLALPPAGRRINRRQPAGGTAQSNSRQVESACQTLPLRSAVQPEFRTRISKRFGSGEARFIDCILLQDGAEVSTFTTRRPGTIRAVLDAFEECGVRGEVGIVVSTLEGIELFALNSLWEGVEIPPLAVGRTYVFDFELEIPLGCDAKYRIDLGYRMPVQGDYVDKVLCAATFDVCFADGPDVRLLFHVPAKIRVSETFKQPA